MLKEDLLATGYFKDNNFLDKYLDLFVTPPEKNFESHHIIPKAYYKIEKKPIDGSPKNLRILSYQNHYLAHYYLIRCTVGQLKRSMHFWFNRMNLKIALLAFDINSQMYEHICISNKENYSEYIKTAHNSIANWNLTHQERSEEHKRKMSESMKKYWRKKKRDERLG